MWHYCESKKDDAEFLRQFIAFLQSALTQRGHCESVRPEFVPAAVEIPNVIRSEAPFIFPGVLKPGRYCVESNQWGAISARDNTSRLMGIRPHECVVVEMCPNEHLRRAGEDD
jgi:hypothetical protein